MLNLIFYAIVAYIFYRVYKSYQRFQHIYYTRETFQNMQVSKEAIASSELGLFVALCAKVAKADGRIDALEAELIGNMFTDISKVFPQQEVVRGYLKEIFNEQKHDLKNIETILSQLYGLIYKDTSKRHMMMSFLINIAFIDGKVTDSEEKILQKIATSLHFSKSEFDALMSQWSSSHTNVTTHSSLEEAYKALGCSKTDDMKTIKKKYRELVKKYHPDIIQAQGADEDYIQNSTKKIQQINEAYEIIKKQMS